MELICRIKAVATAEGKRVFVNGYKALVAIEIATSYQGMNQLNGNYCHSRGLDVAYQISMIDVKDIRNCSPKNDSKG